MYLRLRREINLVVGHLESSAVILLWEKKKNSNLQQNILQDIESEAAKPSLNSVFERQMVCFQLLLRHSIRGLHE